MLGSITADYGYRAERHLFYTSLSRFSSSQEFCDGTTSRNLYASFFKCPEAFLKGAGAEDGEKYGACLDSTQEQRADIISAYLQVLADMRGPIGVDSELPCPKEQIGEAIFRELAGNLEGDLLRMLEIAYVLLESFIPSEEYKVIEDFKTASRFAQQIANGRPDEHTQVGRDNKKG